MRDLEEFERRRPERAGTLLPALASVKSPLKVREWERELAGHPDPEFASYISNGLRNGFRVGFKHASCARRSAKSEVGKVKHEVGHRQPGGD